MTLVSLFRQRLPVPLKTKCIPVLWGPPAPSFKMTFPERVRSFNVHTETQPCFCKPFLAPEATHKPVAP